MKTVAFLANTVAFINCRGRLTIMLAAAARGKKRSGIGENQVRLLDIDTRRLLGFKDELVCHSELAADIGRGGIREFVNGADGYQ